VIQDECLRLARRIRSEAEIYYMRFECRRMNEDASRVDGPVDDITAVQLGKNRAELNPYLEEEV
jgi:hypothetical protein